MNKAQTGYLLRTAGRYVWWKTPEAAIEYPHRLIARIMDIGMLDDVRELLELFPKDDLFNILQNAEIGQFRDRSWHFWHYYLADCGLGKVPPLPVERKKTC
jgi:hypothetical protein